MRALRAHILTLSAPIVLLLSTPGIFDSIDKDQLAILYRSLLNQDQTADDVIDNEYVKQLSQLFSHVLDQTASRSRTGKLWVQYIWQVAFMQHFLREERTGDWKLHLWCVKEMLPHFQSTGPLYYANSARLYLQHRTALEISITMPADEYRLFTEKA